MLISHSRPRMSFFATQGSFIDDPAVLASGRPGETARIVAPGSGTVAFDAVFDTPISPRLVGLLNLTFPVGSPVTVSISSPAGPAQTWTQPIVALPRGERVCWLLLDADLPAASSISVTIEGGAAGTQDIGEFWIGPAVDVPIKKGWSVQEIDKSSGTLSEWSQQWVRRGQIRRQLSFSITQIKRGDMYGVGVVLPMPLRDLLARIDRGQRAVYVPARRDDAGNVSHDVICKSAIFGTAKLPKAQHLGGMWFDPNEIVADEVPVPV
jgi:hypothetical protein